MLVSKLFWFAETFCFLFSPVFYMLSTERRCHDIHVLFGDVSYDIRNAHWHVNNKIKRKFFSEYHKNFHLVLWKHSNFHSCIMTINVNKKKSSSRSYIFHCSVEWKYKFYIFTSENITFSKYAFYFIKNFQYFITLYIINVEYCKNHATYFW